MLLFKGSELWGSSGGTFSGNASTGTYGPGRVNTGGGGGGGGNPGWAGGSGVVILNHSDIYKTGTVTGSNVLVNTNSFGNIVYTFYSSGTIRF